MTTSPPPPKKQPVPFGKYLLLDRINIGGMAEVWRGKSFGAGGFERLVAIKRILPNISEDQDFITMFIDEAKICSQLTHANIAQIYELGEYSKSYFISMEYIPGKDLRAIFDRCRKRGEIAPVPLTCFVVSKMAEGLDYAHRKKDGMGRDLHIVHRDISPQNVLLSYEGEVKVIDFGIAKAANKATKTQAGILKGKFGYMSPEQIRGLEVDRRSDIFAIGVCLYEMLTGERLFVGDSDFAVLEKVRKAEIPPPSTLNPLVPETLDRIVLKALTRDVEQRYAYASELGDDLQRFLITTDSIFSRKDLMQYMKSTFAEEVERERMRLQDYADIKPPEGMLAAIEMGFSGASSGPVISASPPSVAAITAPVLPAYPAEMHGQSPTRNAPIPTKTSSGSSAPHRPSLVPLPSSGTLRRSPSLTSLPKLSAAAPLLSNDSGDEEDGATTLIDPSELGLSPDELFKPAPPLAAKVPSAQIAEDGDDDGAFDKTSVPLPPSRVDLPRMSPRSTTSELRRAAGYDDGPMATSVQRPTRGAIPAQGAPPVLGPVDPDENEITNPQPRPAGTNDFEDNRTVALNEDALNEEDNRTVAMPPLEDDEDDDTNPNRSPTMDDFDASPPSRLPSFTPTGPLPAVTPKHEPVRASHAEARQPTRRNEGRARPAAASNPSPFSGLAALLGENRARLIIAGAGLFAFAIILIASIAAFSKPALGYVLLDVHPRPPASGVKVSLGEEDLIDPTWPLLRQVKAGSTMVMVAVDGYDVITEAVTVREGQDPTKISLELKKAGGGSREVRDNP